MIKNLIRKDISSLEEYVPVLAASDVEKKYKKDISQIIKLDAGENQFGCSGEVSKKLQSCRYFPYYPDATYKTLRKAIAKYTGASFKNIVVGAGSDELLDLILRLFLNPSDKVIDCPPTFGMYSFLVKLNRGILVNVPRKKDFSLNIDEILRGIDSKTKVIFICSPNNPTGNIVSNKEIRPLLQTGKIVVVDEAYFEFSKQTALLLLKQFDNLIIVRTFSKWAGIAGLRLGYMIASSFVITQIQKIKSPYNVNVAAEAAVLTTLKNMANRKKIIETIINEREKMYKELNTVPYLNVLPSRTNFLLINVTNKISELKNTLENNAILVRYYTLDKERYMRVTIGTPKQNDKVIKMLKNYSFKQNLYDGIIFDMDGVLVNTEKSYDQAIKKTVAFVLQNKFRKKVNVTNEDIETIRKLPGFNNDWDLSFTLINFFLKKRIKSVTSTERKTKIYQEAKDIFQTYYLGETLFKQLYKRIPPLRYKNGLIQKEKILFNDFANIAQKYVLGIATSRPRFEAIYTVQRLGIAPFIENKNIIAMEDVQKDKPNPDSLLKAKKNMRVKNPIYVGDTINDVIAAKRANMLSLYIGVRNLGDINIKKTNQLREVIL